MKTLLPCTLLGALLLAQHTLAQPKTTPPPFPGWANKTTPGAIPSATTTPGATTTTGATAAATADGKDFVGQWEGAVMNGDGSNQGQRQMNISLTVTAEKISAAGQGTMGDGTYTISGGAGAVRHIDARGTSGQYAGKNYEGILTVEGNTLKWCSGSPGAVRPKEFRTNPRAGCFLMVLTRKQ